MTLHAWIITMRGRIRERRCPDLQVLRENADVMVGRDRLHAEAERLRALLTRYRNETPLGHQPHMIAHEVDATLKETK